MNKQHLSMKSIVDIANQIENKIRDKTVIVVQGGDDINISISDLTEGDGNVTTEVGYWKLSGVGTMTINTKDGEQYHFDTSDPRSDDYLEYVEILDDGVRIVTLIYKGVNPIRRETRFQLINLPENSPFRNGENTEASRGTEGTKDITDAADSD